MADDRLTAAPSPNWDLVTELQPNPGLDIPGAGDNDPWYWLAYAPPQILKATFEHELKVVQLGPNRCYRFDGRKEAFRVTLWKHVTEGDEARRLPLSMDLRERALTVVGEGPLRDEQGAEISVLRYRATRKQMRVPVDLLLLRVYDQLTFTVLYARLCFKFWREHPDHPMNPQFHFENFETRDCFSVRQCKTKRCGNPEHWYIRTDQEPDTCRYQARCAIPGCGRRVHCRATWCPYHDRNAGELNGDNYDRNGEEPCPDCYPGLLAQVRNARKETKNQAKRRKT